MAGLTMLNKVREIQNVVSSSDFEMFSPEMHALECTGVILTSFGTKFQIMEKLA